jgi:hypothetical protein
MAGQRRQASVPAACSRLRPHEPRKELEEQMAEQCIDRTLVAGWRPTARMLPLVALVLGIVAHFAIAEPLAADGPHSAGNKSKTVRHTYTSSEAIVIPDASAADPYPSEIQVLGIKKGKITDVNLVLRGLNHGNPDDIDVLLVAPDGRNAIVMSDAGGGTDALSLRFIFDDQAHIHLPDDTMFTAEWYKPTDHGGKQDAFPGVQAPSGAVALSTFNGSDPNGLWKLYVVDDNGTASGAFSGGWDLEITAKVKKGKHHKQH